MSHAHLEIERRRAGRWSIRTVYFRASVVLLLGAAALLLLLVAYGAFTTPGFLSVSNFLTIIRSAAIVGIMAIGLTFVTISGNFFLLSVTELAAFASILFAYSVNAHLGFIAILLIVFLTTGGLGALQGILIGLGGNPIVVTLAFGGVIFGAAAFISNAEQILVTRPNAFEWAGSGLSFGIPNVTWIFLALAAIAEFVLKFTTFGRRVYLNGDNIEAARAIGNRDLVIAIQVCAIAGAAGGLVGILFSSQMASGYINHFTGAMGASGSLTLNAVAAVMVGGTAIAGGAGSALRSALGAVFIALVDNMMVLRGIDTGPRIFFVGLIILMSVGVYNAFRGDRS